MSLLDREMIIFSFIFVFVSFKPLCFCPSWSLVAIRKVTDPQYLAMATFGRAGNEPSTPFISCANFLAANTIFLTIDLKLSFLNLWNTSSWNLFSYSMSSNWNGNEVTNSVTLILFDTDPTYTYTNSIIKMGHQISFKHLHKYTKQNYSIFSISENGQKCRQT